MWEGEESLFCYVGAFFIADWLPQEEGRQWRLGGGGEWGGDRGRVAKRNVSSLGVFPPERQALLPQLGLLPLTAVWGQSPSPMASSPLFLLLSPWQPASLGCANRKGPLCPERGWMGEGRQGRRAEPKMLGLGREGKGSGLALLRAGAWRAEENWQRVPWAQPLGQPRPKGSWPLLQLGAWSSESLF